MTYAKLMPHHCANTRKKHSCPLVNLPQAESTCTDVKLDSLALPFLKHLHFFAQSYIMMPCRLATLADNAHKVSAHRQSPLVPRARVHMLVGCTDPTSPRAPHPFEQEKRLALIVFKGARISLTGANPGNLVYWILAPVSILNHQHVRQR